MSATFTLRLGDFDANMLNSIAEQTGKSKTELITEGLRTVFSSRMDERLIWLSPEQFDECLKIITEPETDPSVLARRKELKEVKPVWED